MIIKTKATKPSRTINWSAFREGKVIHQRRLSLTPTTVIPDVIDDVFDKCHDLDPKRLTTWG